MLLNAIMSNYSTIAIPQQRAMNLFRHVLGWHDSEDEEAEISPAVLCETLKLLRGLVPSILDVYGNHWNALCEVILDDWKVVAHAASVFLALANFKIL